MFCCDEFLRFVRSEDSANGDVSDEAGDICKRSLRTLEAPRQVRPLSRCQAAQGHFAEHGSVKGDVTLKNLDAPAKA